MRRLGGLLLLLSLALPASGAAWAQGAGPRVAPTEVNPSRFGPVADAAYGAFQRGLYITALNLALPRAREGDAAAQTLAAEIYSRGLGVRQNMQEAAKWYKLAAEQGVPEAQFQYALMLIDGEFVDKDGDQAFALMEDAANAGNALAQFNYAQMLLERRPGESGVKLAVPYYEKAARTGLADAQYAMAQVYANGVGGKPRDEAEARRWLERAARGNFDTAQLELGSWLVEGIGGPRNEPMGFAWLKRAAQGGNVAAQNRLAKLYVAGVGVERGRRMVYRGPPRRADRPGHGRLHGGADRRAAREGAGTVERAALTSGSLASFGVLWSWSPRSSPFAGEIPYRKAGYGQDQRQRNPSRQRHRA